MATLLKRWQKSLKVGGVKVAAWNDGLGDTKVTNMPTAVQSNGWSMITEAVIKKYINKQT